MTPTLRRLTFLTATRTFDCAYCTAHACAFGDMLRGPVQYQSQRTGLVPLLDIDVNDARLGRGQQAAIKLAMAVGVRRGIANGDSLARLLHRVRHEIGVVALEAVKGVLCVAGYLNTFMDMLGTELEQGLERFTREMYARGGVEYSAGIHACQEGGEETRGWGVVANLVRLVGVAPHMVRASLMEREIYVGMPGTVAGLDLWVEQQLGFVPTWLRNVQGWELKRAMCFALRHNLLSEGEEKWAKVRRWARDERAALMYVYAHEVGSEELSEIARRVARVGEDELSMFARGEEGGKVVWSEAVVCAREVVVAHLQAGQQVVGECVERMVAACPAEAVMELIGMVGWFCYCYRASALFGADCN
eukprot:GFKZ01000019.1.p1 GENE.GFKZ01000019.1~~GFKZ01000019.1.p1  ORF type:complete len:401 (-),score=56.21 GFKZ01000019.1:86-1168(-)